MTGWPLLSPWFFAIRNAREKSAFTLGMSCCKLYTPTINFDASCGLGQNWLGVPELSLYVVVFSLWFFVLKSWHVKRDFAIPSAILSAYLCELFAQFSPGSGLKSSMDFVQLPQFILSGCSENPFILGHMVEVIHVVDQSGTAKIVSPLIDG